MAYQRLVTKVTKENLWLYVTKMLTERPMYAYEISKGMNERFGFSTAIVTVYVVLYKMQREGLIRRVEERTQPGKPSRKYYEIIDKGRESFQNGKMFLERTIHNLV